MAMIGLWSYAEGYYYLDFRTHILHIRKDTPKEIAEKLKEDVEAYIPESRSIFENPQTFFERGITSRDLYIIAVVQD